MDIIKPLKILKEVKPGSMIFEAPGAVSPELCEKIIAMFKSDPRKAPGIVASPQGHSVDTTIKNSKDIFITGLPGWDEVDFQLNIKFKEIFTDLVQSRWKGFTGQYSDEGYKVKCTEQGKLSFDWHTDVDGASLVTRQVGLILYLNTIDDGGGTEFYEQATYIPAVQGKIIVFPPFWTHIHKGCVPVSSDKYILTTFLRFS